jgi:predicted enzyme related to lactoylglutathione lyase
MKNKLTHFAIHVDDIKRAQDFYGKVFKWAFADYGPENFKQIITADEERELLGAIQSRKYSPLDEPIKGMECTISVADVDQVIDSVKANGGKVVMHKAAIPKVGWIAKFLDTEGNLVCVMAHDPLAE